MEQQVKTPASSADFWNERYSSYITVYGDEPNAFFRECLQKIPTGKLLLPAEGEGRNAVFAAKHGWDVDAFDYSPAARSKALARAEENDVNINYTMADINDADLHPEEYDAIALIYVHLKPEERKRLHGKIVKALKPGGHLILEAFSAEQIRNISGGPRNEELLYNLQALEDDFEGLLLSVSRQEQIRLNEGPFHQGKADVVRILATKL
jgi:SAM-dependent methyltransferase